MQISDGKAKCGNGHVLNKYTDPKGKWGTGYKCDVCFKSCFYKDGNYNCKQGCDFDACVKCIEKK